MKTLLSVLFASGFALTLAAQPAPESATNDLVITPELVNQLLAEARTNHPGLRAAGARADAATFATAAVRTWEDPMATIGFTAFGARGMDPAQQGDVIYGVEQKLPLWKKPTLARAVAAAEALAQKAELENQAEILRREIFKALIAAALAERVVELGEEDLATLETITALMEQKLRAGQASAVEWLQLQNESAKRADRLKTDRAALVNDRATLNRLLNRATQSPWPRIAFPDLAPPASGTLIMVYKQIQRDPKLNVMRLMQQQAEAAVSQTRAQRLPDVSVGVQGRQYSGDAGFREGMFTLRLNLPWGNAEKYRLDVRRDEAKAKALAAEIADYELILREETHHLLTGVDAARREALLYRDDILPRTEQALAIARIAWDTGKGMFRDVLDARRMLVEGRVMYAKAVAEQRQLLAAHALHTRSVGFETPEEPGRATRPPMSAPPGAHAPPPQSKPLPKP